MVPKRNAFGLRRLFCRLNHADHYFKRLYLLLSKQDAKIVTNDGFTFYLDPRHDNLQKTIYYSRKNHEPHVVQWIADHIKPGMSVIEVGAHIGSHAVHLCRRVGSEGTVVLLEPFPANYEKLVRNLDVNGFGWAHHIQAAVSDVNGSATLSSQTDSAKLSLALSDEKESYEGVHRFQTYSLDRLMEIVGLERLDFLMVDVEGAEALIFNPEQAVLREKRVKTILCEFHGHMIKENFRIEPQLFLDTMLAFGYQIFKLRTATGEDILIDPGTIDPMKRYRFVFR